MANVLQVAKFIINRIGETTTLKLQKLTYYCQAWSLAWDGKPLFDEDFQAWANGPVCPELFDLHRGLFVVDASLFATISDYNFDKEQLETLESVLSSYADKDSHWLSELTHQERPWRETRYGVPVGDNCSKVIEKDLMQDYYGGLHSVT